MDQKNAAIGPTLWLGQGGLDSPAIGQLGLNLL
jgi:hypothetical protein